MSKLKIKSSLVIIVFFILLIVFALIINNGNFNIEKSSSSNLYINEILAINKNIIKDSYNEYNDYIEIYNANNYDINLSGYFLSDELMSNKKWMFPNIVIKANEYLTVFASGKDICDLSIRECHTNFKLSSKGETVSLLNSDGDIISKIKYPKLDSNIAYSLIDSKYKLTIGTPNRKNEDIELKNNITKDIIINEISSSNEEAIELRNITNRDINLSKYSIKDKSGVEYKFNDTIIKANSYLVLYGSDTKKLEENKIYLGIHINNNDEILYLYKNNQLIDTFIVGKLNDNISKGRNDNFEIVIYKEKSIGKKNSKNYYKKFALIPEFSINGGYVEKGTKVKLISNDDSTIYYTLDGSTPNIKSNKYTGEIVINDSTVIRAVAYKEGTIESDVVSRTYLVGRKHDLSVISISTDNNYLYGREGIFSKGNNASSIYPYYGANFWKEIEIPISFEFYEDGSLALQLNAGMKVFGGWSRGEAQKSVSIYFRKEYGVNQITYPFFENNINTFSRLILRNSGQDYGKTKLKDAFLQEVLEGKMDIDKQDYKPIVVYVNGKYYGLYNLREKIDKKYIENHLGYEIDDLDLIQFKDTVLEGSIDEYKKLLNYVKSNDMKTDEAYEYLEKQIDLQELINYWVVETYYGQTDPGNIKFYKTKNGKWRWLLYDLDQTFTTSKIRWELPFSDIVPNHTYTVNSTLMRNIIKNPKIRKLYIETFAFHLKNTFKPERMNLILDEMVKKIESEMPYHIDRWYEESIVTSQYTITSMNSWRKNISNLKSSIKARYESAIRTVKEGLGLTKEEYNKYFKDIEV